MRNKKKIDYNTDEEKLEKQKKTIEKNNSNTHISVEKKIKDKIFTPGWVEIGSVLLKDYNSIYSNKILGLDLDGTLVDPKSGKAFMVNEDDWKILFEIKLREKLNEYHNEGYKLVIFSNQNGMSSGKCDQGQWERKLDKIVASLKLPILVMAARESDYYRKPSIGMWKLMKDKFNNNIEPDLKKCYYIGDAAGREKTSQRKKDHSNSDLKFAFNCEINFKTPEEFFLNQKQKFPDVGFNPHTIAEGVYIAEDLISNKQEIIIFVGSPASGKTSFFKKYLEPNGYVHVNQDTLKTQPKCLKVAEENLIQGKSIVIDNTNPAANTRKLYIELAKSLNVPIRCFYFKYDKDLVLHLNNLRKINHARKHYTKSVADVIIHSWYKYLEEPSIKEGFIEIKKIEFKPFFESEEDKQIFYMFS